MKILCIDTATTVCSVSICDREDVLFYRINLKEHQHAKFLSIFTQEALHWLKTNNFQIDAVAISQGPGSYTGLRIGVATAKGISYGYNVPLLAVDTLKLIAVSVTKQVNDGMICPMIDARRLEVYDSIYQTDGKQIKPVSATILKPNTYLEWLNKGLVYFCCDGAAKARSIISHPNARFLNDIVPDARYMGTLAEQSLKEEDIKDVAYFEPFYLKEWTAQ